MVAFKRLLVVALFVFSLGNSFKVFAHQFVPPTNDSNLGEGLEIRALIARDRINGMDSGESRYLPIVEVTRRGSGKYVAICNMLGSVFGYEENFGNQIYADRESNLDCRYIDPDRVGGVSGRPDTVRAFSSFEFQIRRDRSYEFENNPRYYLSGKIMGNHEPYKDFAKDLFNRKKIGVEAHFPEERLRRSAQIKFGPFGLMHMVEQSLMSFLAKRGPGNTNYESKSLGMRVRIRGFRYQIHSDMALNLTIFFRVEDFDRKDTILTETLEKDISLLQNPADLSKGFAAKTEILRRISNALKGV